ncbi:hypothetical protein NQ315_008533 [Exocentrus adspersus]|uniref:Peptidase S1 domain-containing protein n=1 Tax=Exocentrus adspersus TaxID=1586481 RepID=A0AAV8W6C8_9CUCU|nr:hypothetical protein NQ315_008533 [Exocentrus adspersus]
MWNKNYNGATSTKLKQNAAAQTITNPGELSKKICFHYFPPYNLPGVGISGGSESLPKEYPHMAAVGYETEEGTEWKCGGSLISKKFVLTAAHCTNDNGNLPKLVRLGDLDLAKDKDDARPQNFSIVKVIPHPLYHPPEKYHDIALLELDREGDSGGPLQGYRFISGEVQPLADDLSNESSGGLPELVQDSEEINLTNTTDESVTLEPVENFGELSKKICLHYHPPYDYEGRFIIGGSESLSREFPHMAAIGYETKEGVQWKCGGSLISKKFVLTAGHCISHKG